MPSANHPRCCPMKYVGIDVHKKMYQSAVLDEEGELLDQIRACRRTCQTRGSV